MGKRPLASKENVDVQRQKARVEPEEKAVRTAAPPCVAPKPPSSTPGGLVRPAVEAIQEEESMQRHIPPQDQDLSLVTVDATPAPEPVAVVEAAPCPTSTSTSTRTLDGYLWKPSATPTTTTTEPTTTEPMTTESGPATEMETESGVELGPVHDVYSRKDLVGMSYFTHDAARHSSGTPWLWRRSDVHRLLAHRMVKYKENDVTELFVDRMALTQTASTTQREVVRVAFDPDGCLVAVATARGTINIYDFDECLRAEGPHFCADCSAHPVRKCGLSGSVCVRRRTRCVESVVPVFSVDRAVADIVWNPHNTDQLAVSYLTTSAVDIFDLNADDVLRNKRRRLVDGSTGKPGQWGCTALRFVERDDSLCVLAGTAAGKLRFWEVAGAKTKKRIKGYNRDVRALWEVNADIAERDGSSGTRDPVCALCALPHYQEGTGTWFAAVTRSGVVGLRNIDDLRSRSFVGAPEPAHGPRLDLWRSVLGGGRALGSAVVSAQDTPFPDTIAVGLNTGDVFYVNVHQKQRHPRTLPTRELLRPTAEDCQTTEADAACVSRRVDGKCTFAVVPALGYGIVASSAGRNLTVQSYGTSQDPWRAFPPCQQRQRQMDRDMDRHDYGGVHRHSSHAGSRMGGQWVASGGVACLAAGSREVFTEQSLVGLVRGRVTLKVLRSASRLQGPVVVHCQEYGVDCVTRKGLRLTEPYSGPAVVDGSPRVQLCVMVTVAPAEEGPAWGGGTERAVLPRRPVNMSDAPSALAAHPSRPYVMAGYCSGELTFMSCAQAVPPPLQGSGAGSGATAMDPFEMLMAELPGAGSRMVSEAGVETAVRAMSTVPAVSAVRAARLAVAAVDTDTDMARRDTSAQR